MAKTMMFIVNPRAGRTRSTAPLFEAVARFSDAGYLVSVRQTASRGDAVRFVLTDGEQFDRIVCCGGDGTLNEVVTGAMQLASPPPIGYIPGGSTNDFAASLHLTDNPPAAALRISASAGSMLDIGSFNGRPFVYVASFGAFTKASYSAPQSIKNDLGHLAYILEGVKDISTLRPYRATITTDSETFDGEFLFGAISNSTSVGGVLTLAPDRVDMADGKLELLLIRAPKDLFELSDCVRALQQKTYSSPMITFLSTDSLTVSAPVDLCWTIDGEQEPGHTETEVSLSCILNKIHEFQFYMSS